MRCAFELYVGQFLRLALSVSFNKELCSATQVSAGCVLVHRVIGITNTAFLGVVR